MAIDYRKTTILKYNKCNVIVYGIEPDDLVWRGKSDGGEYKASQIARKIFDRIKKMGLEGAI